MANTVKYIETGLNLKLKALDRSILKLAPKNGRVVGYPRLFNKAMENLALLQLEIDRNEAPEAHIKKARKFWKMADKVLRAYFMATIDKRKK